MMKVRIHDFGIECKGHATVHDDCLQFSAFTTFLLKHLVDGLHQNFDWECVDGYFYIDTRTLSKEAMQVYATYKETIQELVERRGRSFKLTGDPKQTRSPFALDPAILPK